MTMQIEKAALTSYKIGFATSQFGSGFCQGAEAYIENLASGLTDKGWRTEVFSALGLEGGLVTNSERNSIPFKPLGASGWCTVTGRSVEFFCQQLEASEIDLLHLVHPGHLGVNIVSAARQCNIPVVITLVDYWWLCPKNTLIRSDGSICEGRKPKAECQKCVMQSHRVEWIRKIALQSTVGWRVLACASDAIQKIKGKATTREWNQRSNLLSETLAEAHAVVALSKTAINKIRPLSPDQDFSLIPVGLAPRWFDKVLEYSEEGRKKKVIGFAGSIAPHKGLHTLIAATRDIPGIKLHIAGPVSDSDYWQSLQAHLQEVDFQYYGALSRKDMPGFIDGTDVMVVPSLSPENQPQTVLEAQARRKPVIVSSVPGAAELQPNSNLIFEADSVVSLSGALSKILTDALDSPQPVPSTIEQMADQTIELYLRIFNNRNQQC
jgi:glycosyltransferase involved in cell wall biosynthesis